MGRERKEKIRGQTHGFHLTVSVAFSVEHWLPSSQRLAIPAQSYALHETGTKGGEMGK